MALRCRIGIHRWYEFEAFIGPVIRQCFRCWKVQAWHTGYESEGWGTITDADKLEKYMREGYRPVVTKPDIGRALLKNKDYLAEVINRQLETSDPSRVGTGAWKETEREELSS